MTDLSKKCSVTCSTLLTLIDAIVHTICSVEYPLLDEDEHYRMLVDLKVETIIKLGEEAGIDLTSESARPVGYYHDEPIATLLDRAKAEHGMPTVCPVPGCSKMRVPCGPPPPRLPLGTQWPSCPELCAGHTNLRFEELGRRIRQQCPDRRGPIHAAGMPLPDVALLAPTPEKLGPANANG